jgi:hypothetical protein
MTAPALGISRHSLAAQAFDAAGWRIYEVTTSVKVLDPAGETRVWLPQALAQQTSFQRTLSSSVRLGGVRHPCTKIRLPG